MHMRNALRMTGMCFTGVFCGSVTCFNDGTWHSSKQFFQVTTTLSLGQLSAQYEPVLQFICAISVCYFIKCEQGKSADRHGGCV